jgi:hypothetical protein
MSEPIIREIEHLRRRAFNMSCKDQFQLAQMIASNVGYRLVTEQSIQGAEDKGDILKRLDRLEAAVLEINPGLNWP